MIIAYTDGSANWQNGLGGCGSYIKYPDEKEDAISKGFSQTKTGRMEIMALLETLKSIPDNSKLLVYSDSQYVVNAFNDDRLIRWEKKRFIGVKNPDLWRQVIHELSSKDIDLSIRHIVGHQKVVDDHTEGNYYADALADYKQFTDREKDMPDDVWELQKSCK